MFIAADQGHTDEVKLLLDKGADVNSVTYEHESSLLRAASKGHTDVMRVLVSAGADVNLQDDIGRTPLQVVDIDVVKVLLENNNRHGAIVDAADTRGNRPLYKAVCSVCSGLDVVQLLVQHGPN